MDADRLAGRLPRGPDEVLIAEGAAADLGVEPGQEVTMLHPRSTGPDRFESEETEVTVSGTHPDPFRFPVYMAAAGSELFGVPARINSLDLVPAAGLTMKPPSSRWPACPGSLR